MKTIQVSQEILESLREIQARKVAELEEQLAKAENDQLYLENPIEQPEVPEAKPIVETKVVYVKRKRTGPKKIGLMDDIITLLSKERNLTASQVAVKLKGKYNVLTGRPLARFSSSVNGILCQYSTGIRGGTFLREGQKGSYTYNVKVKHDTAAPQGNQF